MAAGLWPVLDHYYEPLINPARHLRYSLSTDRHLPGISLNVVEQLELLDRFQYNDELSAIPLDSDTSAAFASSSPRFFYRNGYYEAGDAEFLYSIIRHFRPRRLFEIGSGHSTLMARNAITRNALDDPRYNCRHLCIEPFENPWLESLSIEVKRCRVESMEPAFFSQLETGDILFIDSSHMIRPQGDVLFEYLEILPMLNPGVLVHIHDIFTPRDYPSTWLIEQHRLWNEQYLLEAFLSCNSKFRVVGALNYLANHHFDKLSGRFPIFAQHPGYQPGAFWIQKTE